MKVFLAVLLLGAAPARAEVQCMARIGLAWVAVAQPTDAVANGACAPKFMYASEPYTLQGTTMMDGRVTCQWKWSGTASIRPSSGTPESFTCNLFP